MPATSAYSAISQPTETTLTAGLPIAIHSRAAPNSTETAPDSASSHSPVISRRRRIAALISAAPRAMAQTATSSTAIVA